MANKLTNAERIAVALDHLGIQTEKYLPVLDEHRESNTSTDQIITHLEQTYVIDPTFGKQVRDWIETFPADASLEEIRSCIAEAWRTLPPETASDDAQEGSAADDSKRDSSFQSDISTVVPQEPTDPYQTIAGDPTETSGDDDGAGREGTSAGYSEAARFRKIRQHAEGGLGTVSLAQDLDFGRDVAIKEIKARFADVVESQSRFIYEAEVTGRLEHPGIVPVYALGRYKDGRPFYAMRFITGSSLADEIAALHSPENEAAFAGRLRSLLNRFQSVCNTIEYAHSRGVIHRDLKPANIMLGEYGENLVVDWGLAKATQSESSTPDASGATAFIESGGSQTRHGTIVGTPFYMSPEQASGELNEVGPQADVYSLGATLYQVLTGSAPFSTSKYDSVDDLLDDVRRGNLPSPRAVHGRVPKPLNAICLAAMQPDRKDRYKSARELADDIDRYLADEKVSVVRESMFNRMGRWARKNRSWSAALVASTFVIAVATSVATLITLNALEETKSAQRAVVAANNKLQDQLDLARTEQEFDRLIVDEEKRQSLPSLQSDALRIDDAVTQSLIERLEEIEALRGRIAENQEDDLRRLRLLNVWANPISLMIDQPTLTFGAEQGILEEIERLRKRYPWPQSDAFQSSLASVQERLDRRLKQWRPLPVAELAGDAFNKQDDHWVRLPVDFSDQWMLPIEACPAGNVSISVQFRESSLQTPAIGLALNVDDLSCYQFVLADESYDPAYLPDDSISIAEANRLDRLRMYIVRKDPVRGDSVLRQQPVSLGGSLQLRARREGVTGLTFAVGRRNVMEFQDPFPLSPSRSGAYGVICPPDASIDLPILEYQVIDPTAFAINREIQLGDEAFAAGDIGEARAQYSKRPQDVEALFKLALTYEYDQPSEYFRQLEQIVDNHSPSGSADQDASRWYLYAAIRLLSAYNDDPTLRVRMSVLQDELQTWYSMEDIQRLVPTSDKAVFSKMLIKSGQRSRLAFLNEGNSESLRSAIDLFSDDAQVRRMAIWRWCDSIRCDPRSTPHEARLQAIPELKKLLAEIDALPRPDEMERVAIISDLIWMLLLEQQFDEASQIIEPWLEGPIDQIRSDHLPLLLDRARIAYARQDLASAKQDLEAFLQRIDPAMPTEGIHYAHFSEACGMLGIIHEDQGNLATAEDLWRRGRIRNWYEGWPTPQELSSISGYRMVLESQNAEPILVCWSDGYRDGELRQVIEGVLGGSGVDDRVILNIILRSEKIPIEWIEKISANVNNGPRGRAIGRAKLMRQDSMRDTFLLPLNMILYQAILQIAFEGEETLEKYPECDALLYSQCVSLVEHFQQGDFYQREMQFILGAWTGHDWNAKTFEELSTRLDDVELSAGLALVFATQMIKHHGKLELGTEVLQKYVFDRRDQVPPLYIQMASDAISDGKDRL
ncbi:MAG: serine/threonine-protein kinase [Pirellulaceae bacterium]